MKIHFSCSNEAEYVRLNPIINLLRTDRTLKYKEKIDNQGRKQIYFVSRKKPQA